MKRAVRYSQNNQRDLDGMLLNLPGVTSRKMFGYPAYYAGDKMFA